MKDLTGQFRCSKLSAGNQMVNVDVDAPAEDVVVLGVVAGVVDALVVEDLDGEEIHLSCR